MKRVATVTVVLAISLARIGAAPLHDVGMLAVDGEETVIVFLGASDTMSAATTGTTITVRREEHTSEFVLLKLVAVDVSGDPAVATAWNDATIAAETWKYYEAYFRDRVEEALAELGDNLKDHIEERTDEVFDHLSDALVAYGQQMALHIYDAVADELESRYERADGDIADMVEEGLNDAREIAEDAAADVARAVDSAVDDAGRHLRRALRSF